MAAAVSKFGSLDVAVCNAGIVRAADFLEMSEEDFDAVIRINLKGVFLVGAALVLAPGRGRRRLRWQKAQQRAERGAAVADAHIWIRTNVSIRFRYVGKGWSAASHHLCPCAGPADRPGGGAADGGAGPGRIHCHNEQRERHHGHPLNRRVSLRPACCASGL